jgi:cytochrome c biogenesis protein ResB
MDETCELPLFSLRKDSKAWVTAFPLLQPQPQEDKDFLLLGDPLNERTPKKSENKKKKSILVFDKLQSNFLIFNHEGKFLSESSNSDSFGNSKLFLEPLSSTGLFIKADPSIPIIYFGFALMMGTTCLSYLPYTQLWVFYQSKRVWIGGLTNRGKIQLETQLESLIRGAESFYKQP